MNRLRRRSLVSVFCLALAACGGSNGNDSAGASFAGFCDSASSGSCLPGAIPINTSPSAAVTGAAASTPATPAKPATPAVPPTVDG
jgi:hypothetical protein